MLVGKILLRCQQRREIRNGQEKPREFNRHEREAQNQNLNKSQRSVPLSPRFHAAKRSSSAAAAGNARATARVADKLSEPPDGPVERRFAAVPWLASVTVLDHQASNRNGCRLESYTADHACSCRTPCNVLRETTRGLPSSCFHTQDNTHPCYAPCLLNIRDTQALA